MAQYDSPQTQEQVNEVFTDREDLTPETREAIRQAVENASQGGTAPVNVAGATARIENGAPVIDYAQPAADPTTGAPPQVQVVLLDLTGLSGQVAAGTRVTVNLPENMRDASVVTIDADVDIEIVFNTVERVITSGRGNDSITVLGNANTTLESAVGNDTLITSGGNDSITSRGGNDSISSGAGNDTIVTHAGSDTIDAGTGYDVLMIRGAQADYTVEVVDGSLVVNNGTHTATVQNAEFISFADGGTMTVSGSIVGGPGKDTDAATVMRFYETFFDRSADLGGAEYWTGMLQQGTSIAEVAGFFMNASAEWASVVGQLSDAEFAERLYTEGLGRAAESEGSAYWTNLLDAGTISREDLAVFILESDEAAAVHQSTVLYIEGWV